MLFRLVFIASLVICHVLGGLQALQHRNTARQQHLRLDALRHARKQHQEHAEALLGAISGVARSTDLAHTILKAQLQSLHQALQALKVCPVLRLPVNAAKLPGFCSVPSPSLTVLTGQFLHHTAILLRPLLTGLSFLALKHIMQVIPIGGQLSCSAFPKIRPAAVDPLTHRKH